MTKITSSLSQGLNTAANGNYSHAEGSNTEAKGNYSHAEGELTIAIGKGSHASGYGTVAFSDYQTVLGQYNTDKNNTDCFVVGIGQHGTRKDGFGINPTRTYVSTSLVLPNLTKDSNIEILTYNTSTKQVHYGLLSELYIGSTDYATQALTSSYSELAKEAEHTLTSSYSIKAQQSITSISSSYSEQAKNASQAINSSFAINAQQANISISSSYSELAKTAITASYISLAQQAKIATTASHISDPTVVKTLNDVIKLKPVDELPWFIDPGALALYNGDLYFCVGMIGWKKVMLSNILTPTTPPK